MPLFCSCCVSLSSLLLHPANSCPTCPPQPLGSFVQSGGLSTEFNEFHCLPAAVALPLPHHLRTAWHAVIWREVQLWWDTDQEKHLWFLPSGPANLLSGNKLPFNSENITFCYKKKIQLLTFSKLCLFFQNLTQKSKNCTRKMQNASHLLQNEALHSKYHKHIS